VIPNPNMESISLQLTASRYLVSAEAYESAVVYRVLFIPCINDTGEFLCLNRTLNRCKEKKKLEKVTIANALQPTYHWQHSRAALL